MTAQLVTKAAADAISESFGPIEPLQSLVGDEAESVFHAVLESIAEGVSCCDGDGYVVYSNRAMERITGYSFEETKGRRIYEFWYPDNSPEYLERKMRQHERYQNRMRGISEEYETQLVRKDGELRWVEVKASPLRDRSGAIVGSVGVIADITERKRLEGELIWSQKMDAVGKLACSVAHSFNNLLTVISGYGNLLLKRLPEGDANRRPLENVLSAAQSASVLTQQLLFLGRRQDPAPVELDLNAAAAGMLELLKGMVGVNISITTIFMQELPRVFVDATHVQQLLINLALNAKDAMLKGGTLSLFTKTEEVEAERPCCCNGRLPAGHYVVLLVTDTGDGMDAAVQERLFEPFFTSRRNRSGLGLTTVQRIMKLCSGYVAIESEKGLGSTFALYFPSLPPETQTAETKPRFRGNNERGSGMILLVEDEDAVRELLANVLIESGYRVLEANSGMTALDLLKEQAGGVELLVTDVVMPGMTGFELAERALVKYPDLRVISISGCIDDSTIPEHIKSRGIPLLLKPFSPDYLVSKVREALHSAAEVQSR